MSHSPLLSRSWEKHAFLWLFWVTAAVLFVGMRYAAPLLVGSELPDWTEQRWVILGWMMWIPMTYIAVGFARLFPLNSDRAIFYAPVHVIGAVLCSSIGGTLWISLIWLLTRGDIAFGSRLESAFVSAVPIDSIIYFAVLTGVYGFDYYRMHKEEQRMADRLRADLAEAELTTLRTQLNPHFLFNALNAVASHIRENASEAIQMVAELGDFLRAVLDLGGKHAISVDKEIGMLQRYVAVQQIRFQNALTVEVSVDPDVTDAQVPSLMLQPLVENAIHHGIQSRTGGGHIWVIAKRAGSDVEIRVMDDGQGPEMTSAKLTKRGIGLQNVEMRLRHLFGRQYSLSLGRRQHEGTTVTAVTIEVPYREEVVERVEGEGDGQVPIHPGLANIDMSPSA